MMEWSTKNWPGKNRAKIARQNVSQFLMLVAPFQGDLDKKALDSGKY